MEWHLTWKLYDRHMTPRTDADQIEKAQRLLRELEGQLLTDEALVAVSDVFDIDAHKAEVFLMLPTDDFRRSWIQNELCKLNFSASVRLEDA